MGVNGQEKALVAAVSEALDGRGPLTRDFALVVGSVDRRLARPLGRARVVMNQYITGLSLPRDSLVTALCVLGPFVRSLTVDSLVAVRNALAREATFLVVGPPDRVAEVAALAPLSGFSRQTTRLLSGGYGVLELRR